MEFDIELWLQIFTQKLFEKFSSRVKFIGLQGSYKRGEAREDSDVNTVVILDRVSFDDLVQYKQIVHSMEFYEKACGFVAGEKEIYNWPKFDLFQLINGTLPLHGDLQEIVPHLKRADIIDAVKVLSSKLYHNMCHGYVYGDNDEEILYNGYKAAFFILQAVYYINNAEFISTKRELILNLDGEDKEILMININWNSLDILDNTDFYFEKLINWASIHI